MAYNTGNTVPSTEAKDFIDNCENIDKAVNSLESTFQDRLGVTRSTYEGVVQGLSFFNVGTFAVGFTLTNSRQTLTYDGHEYSWSGVFPKVVNAGSTPTPLGSGGWIDRSDVTLRADIEPSVIESLRRSYADAGYTLVAGSFEAGGDITSSTDVLLRKASGIAYSGPIGSVAPGTDPTAVGSGYVSREDVVLRNELHNRMRDTVYAEDYADFATAVATGKNVIYSTDFTIASPVSLVDGQRITNAGTGVITFSGESAFILASKNVLEFVRFSGPIGKFACKVTGNKSDITLKHPVAHDCNLIATGRDLTYASADWVGKTNIASNILLINPVGFGAGGATADETFMISSYVDGFKVIGGRAENYFFGHYYWGGDSSFSADGGSKSNVRKCDNIELIGFSTVDCFYAGLWGSMAQKVRRTNCSTVRTTIGGDVGIDDEGTESAINVNCHAEGYKNGNYAGFFGFSDIQMIGCTSRQYAGYPHYRNYNSSNNAVQSGRVLISGGVYTTIDPQNGFATITAASGPANNFHITGGAKITNSTISIVTNGGSVTVDNAHLDFTVAGSTPWDAIFIKASAALRLAVSDCLITYSVTPYVGSAAIKCNTENFNASDRVTVAGNDTGILPIVLKETGGNAGVAGKYWCYDNITASVTRQNSGAGALTVVRGDNNYTIAGTLLVI